MARLGVEDRKPFIVLFAGCQCANVEFPQIHSPVMIHIHHYRGPCFFLMADLLEKSTEGNP